MSYSDVKTRALDEQVIVNGRDMALVSGSLGYRKLPRNISLRQALYQIAIFATEYPNVCVTFDGDDDDIRQFKTQIESIGSIVLYVPNAPRDVVLYPAEMRRAHPNYRPLDDHIQFGEIMFCWFKYNWDY